MIESFLLSILSWKLVFIFIMQTRKWVSNRNSVSAIQGSRLRWESQFHPEPCSRTPYEKNCDFKSQFFSLLTLFFWLSVFIWNNLLSYIWSQIYNHKLKVWKGLIWYTNANQDFIVSVQYASCTIIFELLVN